MDRDNPKGDRYALELQIVSAEMRVSPDESGDAFPLIEILQTTIVDSQTGERIDGIVGNNFSSYVRDYDFSVVLPEHMKAHPEYRCSGRLRRPARQAVQAFPEFGRLSG